MKPLPFRLCFLPLLIVILLFSACGGSADTTPTPLPVTPTVEITPTSTPEPPAAWLAITGDSPASMLQAAQETIGALASGSSLAFETRQDIQPGNVGAHVRVVIFLAAPPNLNEFLSAAPNTQFVVISAADISSAANLSVIHLQADQQAFLAGYIAELLALDWRAAGLLPLEGITAQAFENGGQYYCGSCAPILPPYVHFPLLATSATSSDATVWQALAEQLIANDLRVMYITPEAASEALLTNLASRGMTLLGGTTPPESVRSVWAVTIQFDPLASLAGIWEGLLAGQGGQQVNAVLTLADLNPALFSVGRQRLAQEVMDTLAAGLVLTTDP
jgi:hypothetical protein